MPAAVRRRRDRGRPLSRCGALNAKFRPVWEPRFLVYPTARDLPRIGISTLRAEAFIALDPRRLLPRAAGRRRGAA